MDAGTIEERLRAAGASPERVESAGTTALVLAVLPPGIRTRGITSSDGFFLVTARRAGDILAACAPGATIVESGALLLEGVEIPVHRCMPAPGLRPHGEKIPEGPGNLKRRAGWFRKRTG
jgi:hypothetical protein